MLWRSQQRQLQQVLDNQQTIIRLLNDVLLRCTNPGDLKIEIGDSKMAGVILFQVVLPPKGADDVVTRELQLSFADGGVLTVNLEASAETTAVLRGPEGTQVTVSLVDVDDAGNRSEPSVAVFDLVDIIPPPKPGELSLSIVGEE